VSELVIREIATPPGSTRWSLCLPKTSSVQV